MRKLEADANIWVFEANEEDMLVLKLAVDESKYKIMEITNIGIYS